jgi:hypothetical protein
MNEKVIVTNITALKSKYGAAGLSKIRAAVQALIAADKGRGFRTRLIALDSASEMKKANGTEVTDPTSARQNKDAIDAIYTTLTPDYLMILGSIDVIPHQDLNNPMYGTDDPDQYAYGDVPYACEAPYSQLPEKFIGPTRVLGRLPDLTASTDPTYLVGLLEAAANWKSLAPENYADYFAVSADVWKGSTALTVQKLFGSNKDLALSPEQGPKWEAASLGLRSHFINCHGAPADSHFYGQQGENFPIAHDAAWIAGKITEGTIAAVECCYGGELYDPNLLPDRQPGICNTYLAAKAYGYLGSSTIAYGPADGNGAADLLCQYFLKRVLAGSSLGRAALEARQEFAQSGPDLDPVDLKTIAQFSLFGDPSIHPVAVPTPHVSVATAMPKGMPATAAPIARSERRRQLLTKGLFIGATQSVARTALRTTAAGSVLSTLRRLAADANIAEPKILSFTIQAGAAPSGALAKRALAAAMAKLPAPSGFHVVTGTKLYSGMPIAQITAVVATETDGKVVSYRQMHSR